MLLVIACYFAALLFLALPSEKKYPFKIEMKMVIGNYLHTEVP
jgi:hypothetical protein